ncbi:hypothetical protein [Parasitella parasitica]|uniref:Uncharacterized protein n=1 Tax=Parasitella parasitica TaxID=35722 RepID=A0A0B7NLJ5_9FUNG|nr:hypothetical protein [Parasitella parasitica]
MQRDFLYLQQQQQQQQQQAMARQMQQQRASGGPDLTTSLNSIWARQQIDQVYPLQQQQLENENTLAQQKPASMHVRHKDAQLPQQASQLVPSTSQLSVPPPDATVVETELQQKTLDLYAGRDQQYQLTLDAQHKRHVRLAQSKKREIDMANNERRVRAQNRGILTFGKGYDGYGNSRTSSSSLARILFPADKKQKRSHQAVKTTYQHCRDQADKEEALVPIRLDLENDGFKVRDTFTWNMNESSITPEQFADITCQDLRLPTTVFSSLISASIKEQVQEYFLNASSMVSDSQDQERKRLGSYQEHMQCKTQKTGLLQENRRTIKNRKTELRTLIKLDIIVGNRILNDQFEWDITCKKNSPESFAETMATELGLGGEFKTAIAHSIREQIYVFIKSLLLTGYDFGDGPVENDELRRSFLPAIRNVVRDYSSVERFTPSLIEITDAEIAKIEKDRTRESRRKRRGVRNRKGAGLPDREPVPTYRTIFASPLEHEMTDDQFLKSMQATQDVSAHSQRRSAMKARMNIAAEAAGVSLTSGQLVANNEEVPSAMDQMTRPALSKCV